MHEVARSDRDIGLARHIFHCLDGCRTRAPRFAREYRHSDDTD
jgi:hypothetical protein